MKTLAIIDDEQDMEEIYSIMLQDSIDSGAIELKFFSDSRKFVAWLDTKTPDLVLCDINMPHLSGVEVAKILKARHLEDKLYFVSGYEPRAYAKIMSELGVTHFLTKPLDYDVVMNSINSELGL